MIELYYRVRATSGAMLTDEQKHDPIVQKNLAIIDRIIGPHEQGQAVALALAPLLAR